MLTTNAGLWSYVLGDTVTLVSRDPPRVLVSGRVSWSLSVAGEHLVGQELDAGMAAAAEAVGGSIADYAAAALPPDAGDARGGHLFIVELDGAPPDRAVGFAAALDTALARLNADYAAHGRAASACAIRAWCWCRPAPSPPGCARAASSAGRTRCRG